MATLSIRPRAEHRVPLRLFVKLSDPDGDSFEISQTLDISLHGARVRTQRLWEPNEQIHLRSLRGNFSSYARVAHFERLSASSYSVGLHLLNPIGAWPTRNLPAAQL